MSGKSTLLMDVLFHECQRQYLEALSLEGIHKPKVERIRGLSPAVMITQAGTNNNPRSTVGTMTDIYTDLRMLYEKLSLRECPHCNKMISSADCREETEKIGNDFRVYMYCSECGKRMDKLTRTDFSFNTREGACPACEGLENTVLVIEHDTDIMAADYIVDIGPGSGSYGGEIVATGTLEEIKMQKTSVTGSYLLQPETYKTSLRKADGNMIHIENADKFHLKSIHADIPVGCLTAITGPSGSGKSTLIFEVLAKGESKSKKNAVTGLAQFDKVVEIEQSPITRMKRSNVATYSEVYTEIRNLFAKQEKAKQNGFTAKHFSFNTSGGRCENCEGLGYVDSNMLFFSNVEVVCPVCNGDRFHERILDVTYHSLSITDVLKLSVEEASDCFKDQPKITKVLNLLLDVGLSYLELGQTLTTLSGGEGQRLKLAKELIVSGSGRKNLYLMDEPTTGLHPIDVEHFLILLNRMVDAGNTVVVVEHNVQLIKNCDFIIELGLGGGEKGGEIVFTGTPAEKF